MTLHKIKTQQVFDEDSAYRPRPRQRVGKYPRKQSFNEADFRPKQPKRFERSYA